MSFPPRLSLHAHATPADAAHADSFNAMDWPLSNMESFRICTRLPPDRLKEIASGHAFWNAAINRWGLDALLDAWNTDQLQAVMHTLQHLPRQMQQSPRMVHAPGKVFDSLIQKGLPAKDKICACVNALEMDNIVPVIRSMDSLNHPIAEILFPQALQEMEIPQQKEFLTKFTLGCSSLDRMLPLFSDAQQEAVLEQDPVLLAIKRSQLSPVTESQPRLTFLVNNPLFSDVVLVVEGVRFRAHRVILASASRYFKAMFGHGMRESNADTIEMKEISATGFVKVLEYLYTGRVEFYAEEAKDLMVQADLFQLNALKDRCLEFVRNK